MQGEREISFADVESALGPLLTTYAPQVESRHQPELPYWHLRNKGLWDISGAADLPLQAGGFPQMAALRHTSGQLDADFASALESDPAFLRAVVSTLLDEYFSETIHSDILDTVGIRLPQAEFVADRRMAGQGKRNRDPNFRHLVLRAYEHRCAVTGFRAALGGQYFGCEAAHVQMHAFEGPDRVENGFAVEPTLHKLFDVGAWTLSDDRRIIVSAELTGAESTVNRVRSLHGCPLRKPILGEPEIAVDYIRWHRESDLGGIFRHPALPLS